MTSIRIKAEILNMLKQFNPIITINGYSLIIIIIYEYICTDNIARTIFEIYTDPVHFLIINITSKLENIGVIPGQNFRNYDFHQYHIFKPF